MSTTRAKGATTTRSRRPARTTTGTEAAETTAAVTTPAPTVPGADWRRIDLHLHTPASNDYQEPRVTPIQILQQAEVRHLDIIAFTDHNSVRGYAEMWREIEDLELLEHLNRLQPAESQRLAEYRRLLGKVLVLPGFEFTATFGFHILAIFPEGTSIRLMEHLLMLLNVSEDRFGSGEVGATTDVLKTYETLADNGALVIGAHVNSTHGVAMQGLRFGGQTKIAYTQDANLHALEVTDLALGDHRRSTARFFSGVKSEYPRRMHCIQGSDAHRLVRDPVRDTNLGVGDRATEVLLGDVSFTALKTLFASDEFDRTRPFVDRSEVVEHVLRARSEGNAQGHAFHESYTTKRAGTSTIVKEIVGMANADGGTVYVGASPFEKRPIAGVEDEAAAIAELERDIAGKVVPALDVVFAAFQLDQKTLLSITVLPGPDRPYAYGGDAILVRVNGETTNASRDQIVGMVRAAAEQRAVSTEAPLPVQPTIASSPTAVVTAEADPEMDPLDGVPGRGRMVPSQSRSTGRTVRQIPTPATPTASRTIPPRVDPAPSGLDEAPGLVMEDAGTDPIAPPSGVEILASHEIAGERFYTVRDLRHGRFVSNVPARSEQRLWRYAIARWEEQREDPGTIRWMGDRGYLQSYRARGGDYRHNLAYRDHDGLRFFYGVNGSDLDPAWSEAIPDTAYRRTAGSRAGEPETDGPVADVTTAPRTRRA